MNRDQIREVFLAHGFTVKPGHDDLKPYVYEAAEALLALAAPEAAEPVAPNWEAKILGEWAPVKGAEAAEHLRRRGYEVRRAPTDSQAGRDAVEAFTDRQCLLLSFALRYDSTDAGVAVDSYIEHSPKWAVEKAVSEVRAALSIATGRAAE